MTGWLLVYLILLTIGCISLSVRLTLVTRRLKRVEAILQNPITVNWAPFYKSLKAFEHGEK